MNHYKESEENRLKKFEELYAYAKHRLDDERARFERIDTKVSRYFSVLTVFLGFFAVSMGRSVQVFERLESIQDWGFTIAYGAIGLLIFLAFISFYRALKLQDTKTVEINEILIEHYLKHRYVDVLFSVSNATVGIIKSNRAIIDDKVNKAQFGYHCILWVIVLVPVALGLYLWSFLSGATTIQP